MKLGAAVKTSLNELRMPMLGQCFPRSTLRGLVEDAFEELAFSARAAHAAALLLMMRSSQCPFGLRAPHHRGGRGDGAP